MNLALGPDLLKNYRLIMSNPREHLPWDQIYLMVFNRLTFCPDLKNNHHTEEKLVKEKMIIELNRHGHVALFAKKHMLKGTVIFSKCQKAQQHLGKVKMHIELFY